MTLVRRIPLWLVDWVIVAVTLPVALHELLTDDAFAAHRVLGAIGVVGFIVPFALRRRWPLAALTVAWISCCAASIGVASFVLLDSPFALLVYSGYIAGTIPDRGRSVVALAMTLAGLTVANLTNPDAVGGDYVFPTGFVLAMYAGSRLIYVRTLLAAELHEAAARAAERREEAAARAVVEERRRIAREMHDLVGHSVSVMVVQAGGARRILDRDPGRAVEAAERIEATGRAALAEMRRLLGLLAEGEEAVLEPQPTLDGLDALVDRARAAGLTVALRVEGDRRPLPAGAEIAVYRIVQEALTNALKHAAAAPTGVLLRWEADVLDVLVTGDPAGGDDAARGLGLGLAGGGHGLVGMRERMRVYDGTLDAGPRPGGGFEVHARLPLARAQEPVA